MPIASVRDGNFSGKVLSVGGWTAYKCLGISGSTFMQGDSAQFQASPYHRTETLELRFWAAGWATYTSSSSGELQKGSLRKLAILRLAQQYFVVFTTLNNPPNVAQVERVPIEDFAGQQVEEAEEMRLLKLLPSACSVGGAHKAQGKILMRCGYGKYSLQLLLLRLSSKLHWHPSPLRYFLLLTTYLLLITCYLLLTTY